MKSITKATKVVLTSALAIAASASLITGATYAIFTSESKTEIAITSGKVEVTASVDNLEVYSPTSIDGNTCKVTDATNAATTATKTFINGGTASLTDNKLTLTDIFPGDKVTFDVSAQNGASSVACKYRMRLDYKEEDKDFIDEFLFGVKAEGETETTYYSALTTEWKSLTATETSKVTLELPSYVGNRAQGKSAEMSIVVEAVQGNVTTTGSASASKVYVVTTPSEITTLLGTSGEFVSGETIVLGGNDVWETAEISTTKGSTSEPFIINLRGFKVGTLTIKAANATVNQYLDVGTLLDIQAIAGDSYHIYGKVPTAKVAQGHVVVEKTAEVGTVTLAPAAGKKAKLTVNSQATVEKVVVPTEAAGDVAVENSGIIEEIENPADKEITLFECDFSNPDDEILFCPACYKSGTTENHAEHNPIEKGGSGLKFENSAAIILREGCWLNYKMVGNKVTFDYDFDMSTVKVGDYVTFDFGEVVNWSDVKTGFKRTNSGFDLYNTVQHITDEYTQSHAVLKNYTTDNMNIHMKYVLTYDEETKISTMELFLNNEEKAVITNYTKPLEKGFGVYWNIYILPTENVGQKVNGTISNLKVTLA